MPNDKRKDWTMPTWMEPYRSWIVNTGGNSVEEMMNSNVDVRINLPVAMLSVAVQSQVALLNRMHQEGALRVPSPSPAK